MNTFSDFALNEKILKTLSSIGFSKPTPIQQQAIPVALEGKDVIACAQTGTGKTGAFLLPALHTLADSDKASRAPQVLVLVPTRELAEQVCKEAVRFSKHLPHIKTVCVYGGVPYPVQLKWLHKPYQILVATPGRLMDYLERGKIDLSQIRYFVLDEADRMLDMGFIDAVEEISDMLPKGHQTLMFSATLNQKVRKISKHLQKDPHEITIIPEAGKEAKIEQRLYYVDNADHKYRLLDKLLSEPEVKQAIVFTSTKIQADRISDELRDNGFKSAPLHGNITQKKRTFTLDKLRQGRLQILVATDVAARGIDISTLSHVINYDIPYHAEDFVHRIGRTGRAGASGIAITFATYSEKRLISDICKLTGKEMEILTIEGMEPKPEPMRAPKPHDTRRGPWKKKNSFPAGRRRGGFKQPRFGRSAMTRES